MLNTVFNLILGMIAIAAGMYGMSETRKKWKKEEMLPLAFMYQATLIFIGVALTGYVLLINIPKVQKIKTIIGPEDLRDNSYYSVMSQASDKTCAVVLLKDSPDSDPRTVKIYKPIAPETKFVSKKDLLDLVSAETPASDLN